MFDENGTLTTNETLSKKNIYQMTVHRSLNIPSTTYVEFKHVLSDLEPETTSDFEIVYPGDV